MKYLLLLIITSTLLSCSKPDIVLPAQPPEEFTRHTIPRGDHYSDKSIVKSVRISKQVFKVKFDSSAIYTSLLPENQYDINKLYGFSEGNDHHINSARIGWRYNDDSLRLFAYTYFNGQRLSEEICAVIIGETIDCSIEITGNSYHFKVNQSTLKMDRALNTDFASGYQLYPYFGGDETAPHSVSIMIRDL
ncbi:MAG: hypothetical protein WKF35_12665 [Ferruginibacter sp.]